MQNFNEMRCSKTLNTYTHQYWYQINGKDRVVTATVQCPFP